MRERPTNPTTVIHPRGMKFARDKALLPPKSCESKEVEAALFPLFGFSGACAALDKLYQDGLVCCAQFSHGKVAVVRNDG